MVDGAFTLATPPPEFIITKINTFSEKNTDEGGGKRSGLEV
jgi:hypothetical protein